MDQARIAAFLEQDDLDGLARLARPRPGRVLRFLVRRLYSPAAPQKWRAVRALGVLAAAPGLLDPERTRDLLRRFFWSLNDESGAVPFGIPEAIGEILAVRPEFQPEYLPPLCCMVTDAEMIQTGPIEQGVLWALGRIGPPVADCSPQAVRGIGAAAGRHTEAETRRTAAWALARIQGLDPGPPEG